MKRKHILILILFSIGIKLSYLLIPVIVNQSGSNKPFYDQYISSDLPDGLYMIRLQAGNESAVGKLLVVH